MTTTAIHTFDLPLDGPVEGKRSFPAFRGPTRSVADMGCHASVLAPGCSPHPPHVHPEEEILIPLHGEVELVIATAPDDPKPRRERLRPGSFVYYPAGQHHTIHNPGSTPVAYLMFKWLAAPLPTASPAVTAIHHFGEMTADPAAPPFSTRRIFEGPTSLLEKLHAHVSFARPGGGYAAHADAHDVAIVLLEGAVETLGRRVEPLSVIYYSAGEMHGMKSVGDRPARYLVFELHASGVELPPPPLHARVAGGVKAVLRPVWRLLPLQLRKRLRGIRT